MDALWSTSHISGGNAHYVEEVYEAYLSDPNSVSQDWRNYFDTLPRVNGRSASDIPHSEIIEYFETLGRMRATASSAVGEGSVNVSHERKQVEVVQLINAYRLSGHQKADLDPLSLREVKQPQDLDLSFHNLNSADLDSVFQTGDLAFGYKEAKLKDIIGDLESTYCSKIGSEIIHVTDYDERRWLINRLESTRSKPAFDEQTKRDTRHSWAFNFSRRFGKTPG